MARALVAIFAHNEERRIAGCINSLPLASDEFEFHLLVNGTTDRGVRRARYQAVLRGHSHPAVLIEGGYLSNPPEARKIADPAYRQKLAEAVARALE